MAGNRKKGRLFLIIISFLFSLLIPFASSSAEQSATDGLGGISLGELLNLEVSVATKTGMTPEEAPSIVTVITGEEIRNTGAGNLNDVLRMVPGFDIVHRVNIPSRSPNIRGMPSFNNQKSKLMINGHWMNSFDGGSQYFMERLPLSNIRQIEIIRGPGSALYGAGAFLGVINIVTREGGDAPSEISLTGGSYGTLQPSGELSYQKGGFKADIYADYYQSDGYDGIIGSDAAAGSSSFDSPAPGEMTAETEHCNLQARISYHDLYFSGLLNSVNANNPVGVARILADEDDVDAIYGFAELGYRLPFNENGDLLVKTYFDFFKFENLWEIFPEETAALPLHTGFPEGEGLYGNPSGKTTTFGGELTADYDAAPGVRLVGGALCDYYRQFDAAHAANYNLTGHDLMLNGERYPPSPYQYFTTGLTDISEDGNWSVEEADRVTIAAYGQGTFDLRKLFGWEKRVENLSLTAGLRYDHYDDIGSSLNPRFGLVYGPTEKFYFKFLYGEAFRAPSFSEMYYRNNPNVDGNPNLNPETIRTVEGLIGYNFSRHFKSCITFFHVRVEDLIERVGRTYENEGEMTACGIEGELRWNFDRYRYAYCNFTLQDVRNTTHSVIVSEEGRMYTQEDFGIGGIPKWMFNAGIHYDFSRYVMTNVSLNYTGKRNRSEEMAWEGEELVRMDTRDPVAGRTLVNASVTFRNFYKGLEIQLSGFNLFNTDHRDPDEAGALEADMPEPGRWFSGRVSYSF